MEKPQTPEQSREKLMEAYREWQQEILPRRIKDLARREEIDVIFNRLEIETTPYSPEQLNNFEDEQHKINKRLSAEEKAWKEKHGVEVYQDETTGHYVPYVSGNNGVIELDFIWLSGWISSVPKAYPISKKPRQRKEDVDVKVKEVIEVKVNDKYL